MVTPVTIAARVRATIITSDFTYQGHELRIEEDVKIAHVVDRVTSEPIRSLFDVAWSSPDGTQWRVEGVNADGDAEIWDARRVCVKCTPMQIVPTPAYAIPS